LNLLYCRDKAPLIKEVSADQLNVAQELANVIEPRALLATNQPPDLIAASYEVLGQIRAVLTGDTGDKRTASQGCLREVMCRCDGSLHRRVMGSGSLASFDVRRAEGSSRDTTGSLPNRDVISALAPIARSAQELDVVHAVRAAPAPRDLVIEMQVFRRAALHAPALVADTHGYFDVLRDHA
jgi:hypothetical protein